MNDLSIEQRQQLTDYHLGLLSDTEADDVLTLLSESSQAREFIERVKQTLKPLNALPEPQAPESLVYLTLARVRSAAALENQQKSAGLSLLGVERSASAAKPRLLRVPELITIAASIALVVGLLVPTVSQWRRTALRQSCANQQASIGLSMRNYAAANQSSLPFIPRKTGATWMRPDTVGPKRTDTSNLFLLVKLDYAKPKQFLCPCLPHSSESLDYSTAGLTDFPSESLISYSYQNMFGSHRPGPDSPPTVAILADRNPLLKLGSRPTPATLLLVDISPNHGSDRGHNVLRLNWSVDWSTTARAGYNGDNIWLPIGLTSTAKTPLLGREVPANIQDSFLGP